MSFQVYSSDFLPGLGNPTLVVTEPSRSGIGTGFLAECHAFFCGSPESYALFTVSFKEEDRSYLDPAEVSAAAKQRGELYLKEHLAETNKIRYQAILAGFSGDISPSENKLLLHLHLRNFLSPDIESKIENNTGDTELKRYIQEISELPRVTTERKI